MPERQMLTEPRSGGGLLLLRRNAPLTRRTVAYFCSGAHNMSRTRIASTTTFDVSLYSGRPHQIRIHLASIGHPLVGDPLYGSTGQPLENLPGLPGDGGYFLHAQFLKFHHTTTAPDVF